MKLKKNSRNSRYNKPKITAKKIVFKNILFTGGFEMGNGVENPMGSELATWLGSCGSGTAACTWFS